MEPAPLLRISVFLSDTHNQTGPLWCWLPSGWSCACPRPLWVSPTTSPMRLGVSPAATPTPTGVFSQRFEALFPHAGALGCTACFAPPLFLLVYLCANVGPWGLLEVPLPAPFVPQSATSLGPALWVYLCANVGPWSLLGVTLPSLFVPQSATSPCVLSTPAAHLHPSYWSV